MNFGNSDWRQRRNLLNHRIPLGPMHYSISNYSTDSRIDKKIHIDDMRTPFGTDDLLDRLHLIPDPLKKNLADTVITAKKTPAKTRKMSLELEDFDYETDMDEKNSSDSNKGQSYPTLTGIVGIFSSFIGAIFHKRPKSPAPQFFDCFEHDSPTDRQAPPYSWQASKNQDQNKIGRAPEQFSAVNDSMNNCRAAAVHCEDKLNAVRGILGGKSVPNPPKFRTRRPRRVFVEPGSIEDSFEDAISPEDFISLEAEEYVEYISLRNNHNNEICEVDAPKIKCEVAPVQKATEIVKNSPKVNETPPRSADNINESLEIVKNLPEITETKLVITEKLPEKTENKEILNSKVIIDSVDSRIDTKEEVIASCEDKMARLKTLLEKRNKVTKNNLNLPASVSEPVKVDHVPERPKKPSKSIPIDKPHDKRFKDPHSLRTDKRRRSKLRKNIKQDMLFAHDIDSDDISSVENSPNYICSMQRLKESPVELETALDEASSVEEQGYFDEIKGRFRSTSTTESEDSFQIVFTDNPKQTRVRRPSDCESEDSFIVFEDSPDSCYTSNDVFGVETTDESGEEYDSDVKDSGLEVCILSHSMSRTVSDLTDDSLYEDPNGRQRNLDSDEVDCAVRIVCEEIPYQVVKDVSEEVDEVTGRPGLLVDAARKLSKKNLPPKSVTFSTQPPKVHVLRVWAFAARQARAGHWEVEARDRERFKRRIADADLALSWVLKPQHRSRVMFQRFMPWRNAQKRKEIADRKLKEQEERNRVEEERKKDEEGITGEVEIDTDVNNSELGGHTPVCLDIVKEISSPDLANGFTDSNIEIENRTETSKAKDVQIKNPQEIVVRDKFADLKCKKLNGKINGT